MEKLLVTQGLNELKLLDSRILKEISNAKFVKAAKTSEKKVTPYETKEDFITNATGKYQSIKDLINRRAKIKAAIVASNAVTEIEVGGRKMTVAEALELKTSIFYKENLLDALKTQRTSEVMQMNQENVRLESKIDNILETMVAKEAKTKKEDFAGVIEPMRLAGEFSLVDPIGIDTEIQKLDNEISGFKSEIDGVLQISNCVTYIEF